MNLYTSLVRLKQEMNNGVIPVMTPIPEKIQDVIDPAFTIGMGALYEDAEKGLRCPVRGCGVYRHVLTKHLDSGHRELGGASGIKDLLSIPHTARLVSRLTHARLALARERKPSGGIRPATKQQSANRSLRKRAGRSMSRSRATVGAKNLRAACEAQVAHKLIALSPNSRSRTYVPMQQ